MLIEALRQLQARRGFLSPRDLRDLAKRTDTKLSHIEEITTYFPHFRRAEPPRATIHVCRDMVCRLHKAADLLQKAKDIAQDGVITVEPVSCLGRCDRAPAACIGIYRGRHGGVEESFYLGRRLEGACDPPAPHDGERPADWPTILNAVKSDEELPSPDLDIDLSQRQTPWSIDYRQPITPGPFAAVRKFLESGDSSASIIDVLKQAGLQGMGGALGQAFKKWQKVLYRKAWPKYVVCNGDESEPATFKDRELLLRTPHLVVEGMLLAGLCLREAKGCSAAEASKRACIGYVFIRHEYPEQAQAVRLAIAAAREAVPAAFEKLDLQVFVSPGGYICGEASALLEVLEDRRAAAEYAAGY